LPPLLEAGDARHVPEIPHCPVEHFVLSATNAFPLHTKHVVPDFTAPKTHGWIDMHCPLLHERPDRHLVLSAT
jgi:hypothetical protein